MRFGRQRLGLVTMSGRELQRIEILSEVLARRRSEISAAAILGLSMRQTFRLLARYQDGGGGALIHKARGRTSNNRLIPGIREYVIELFGRAMPISARAWRRRFCSRRTESRSRERRCAGRGSGFAIQRLSSGLQLSSPRVIQLPPFSIPLVWRANKKLSRTSHMSVVDRTIPLPATTPTMLFDEILLASSNPAQSNSNDVGDHSFERTNPSHLESAAPPGANGNEGLCSSDCEMCD
jgi:hypothetical protein